MKTPPTPSETVTMVGGVLTFVASFFTFYTFSTVTGTSVINGTNLSVNAWDGWVMPIPVYAAIAGALSAGIIALGCFTNLVFPPRFGSFTWEQIHLLLAVLTGLIMFGYLINSGGLSFGIGFWGMIAGSGALIGGAVLRVTERTGPRG